MDILKRLFSPIRESRKLKNTILVAMIRPFFNGVIAIATVEIMKRIIEWIESGSFEETKKYFYIYCAVVLLWICIRYIARHRWYWQIRPRWYRVLSWKYLKKYIYADNTEINKLWTWRAQHIISSWIKSWLNILWELSIELVRHLSKIIFSLILVFNINRIYWIIYLVITSLIIWIYIITQNKANIYRRARKLILIDYERQFVRLVMSKFEVLQNWKIDHEIESQDPLFDRREENNRPIDHQRTIWWISASLTVDWLRILAIAVILFWLLGGWITIAEFVALLLIIWLLNSTVFDISNLYVNNMKEMINVEKLRDLFDEIPKLEWYNEWNSFKYIDWNIQLKNIWFSYNKQWWDILSDFSLDLVGWNKTALVWISWSGKSTIIKLITWYIRPDKWNIIVDGQDLTEVSLKTYYKHIWYLTQEPSVFDWTIRDNLLYAVDDATEEQLSNAVKLSKCEFIYNFPDGLNTEIWEKWVRLSWWQRQRLAIAKIFLKNPKIIVLDEPTSSLDSFSEEAITEAMNELFRNRTVIIIAHRLQTVKNANDIIVIDEGIVIERGTHADLLQQWWSYAKMLELQSWF